MGNLPCHWPSAPHVRDGFLRKKVSVSNVLVWRKSPLHVYKNIREMRIEIASSRK